MTFLYSSNLLPCLLCWEQKPWSRFSTLVGSQDIPSLNSPPLYSIFTPGFYYFFIKRMTRWTSFCERSLYTFFVFQYQLLTVLQNVVSTSLWTYLCLLTDFRLYPYSKWFSLSFILLFYSPYLILCWFHFLSCEQFFTFFLFCWYASLLQSITFWDTIYVACFITVIIAAHFFYLTFVW